MAARKKKLLDEVRDLLRFRHYALTTERTYIYWIKQFILFHHKQHPRQLPKSAISEFLTHLATSKSVAPSTQNQALNALVFLYREVLAVNVQNLPGIEWAKQREHIPVVFSRDEVARILSLLPRTQKIIAALLYGCGLRLSEALRLRRKDIDYERNQIAIWDSKSMKDRLVMLPQMLKEPLREHLNDVKSLWLKDRAIKLSGVQLPDALARKYPKAGESYKWFWVFPSQKVSKDPRTLIVRRHHLYFDIMQNSLSKALMQLAIEKHATCHTFRHSFATHLLEDGVIFVRCKNCWAIKMCGRL